MIRQAFEEELGFSPPDIYRQQVRALLERCLLYTSDAADERSSVDLGGRRLLNKKKTQKKKTNE